MSQEIDHAKLARDIALAMKEVEDEGKSSVSELIKHAGTVVVVLVPIGTFILGLNSDIIVMRETQKALMEYKSNNTVNLDKITTRIEIQENTTSEIQSDIDDLFKGQSTLHRKLRGKLDTPVGK